MADNGTFYWPSVASSGVTTVNGLSGAVVLAAGTGISITPSGQTLTFAATGGGDVTLAAFGSTPNANGLSLSSQVLNMQPADATHPGGLLAADWVTFNSKQAAGSYITALTGDVTASGPGSVAATLAATSNATLTTLSGLTTAASLATVGTITSGTWSATTIAVNKGGTGQITAAAAFNALSPITTTGDMIYSPAGATSQRLAIGSTGNVLTVTGGVPTWAPPATAGTVTSVAASVPSILSISGSPITSSGTLAITYSGTALPIANGGTSGTTKAGAFDALSPMTTGGDLIYGGASGTGTRLANGSAGNYLKSAGGTSAPAWQAFTAPTVQKFTSGSAQTYTTAVGALYIKVRMVGGGGGGSGSGTAAGTAAGDGTLSSFGTSLLVANPGVKGTWSGAAGTGGTASLGTGPIGTASTGNAGQSGGGVNASATTDAPGGNGGATIFGGSGAGGLGTGGSAAIANSGSGGGGGGNGATVGTFNSAGSGGGTGGLVEAIITSPSATYTYTVGGGGAGGGAGTAGFAGGAGGTGYIEVTEYYT